MANQRTKEVKQLNGRIANLERQLSHMKALKEKSESEKYSAKKDAEETKVCMCTDVLPVLCVY